MIRNGHDAAMRFPVAPLLVALLITPTRVRAQRPPAPAQSPAAPWSLNTRTVRPLKVPQAVREQLEDLEYDDTATMKGLSVDLNGDGAVDYLVLAAPTLCGNGGCPFAIVDGASGRLLGEIEGAALYVLAERAHGFPVIEAYNSMSAESATVSWYTYDGTEYHSTKTVTERGAALDSARAALARIPPYAARSIE
jgi:hypothetical protein